MHLGRFGSSDEVVYRSGSAGSWWCHLASHPVQSEGNRADQLATGRYHSHPAHRSTHALLLMVFIHSVPLRPGRVSSYRGSGRGPGRRVWCGLGYKPGRAFPDHQRASDVPLGAPSQRQGLQCRLQPSQEASESSADVEIFTVLFNITSGNVDN